MLDTFWESVAANGLLAVAYAAYKIFDRCANSKCRVDKTNGFTFDLGDPANCPGTELEKISDLLKQRSMHYKGSAPPALVCI